MKLNLKSLKCIDWLLYALPVIFVVLGVSIIYSLTYYSNINLFYSQLTFAIIGLILMIVFSFLDYKYLRSMTWVLYFIGLASLVLVLFWGKTTFGATRWINFGFFDFQPSELFKLILVIVLSGYLADKIGRIRFKHIIVCFIVTIIPTILVMLEPDLGTAIIFVLVVLSCFFASRLNFRQIIIFILVVVLFLPIGWFVLKDYQRQRIATFLNPSSDPYGSGYNITQSLITVGSGGIWGRGFGHGPQSQFNFLPVAHTDFVFAGIAEATGFVGSVVLLLLFAILLIKIISLSKLSQDGFGSIFTIGIATIILVQVIVNIGMNIGLAPVTGMPLPFISYGGSSLIIMLISIGILQSIHLRQKRMSLK